MNLEQLQQGLGDLYPQLRTRSGKKITTDEAEGTVTPEGLAVTVKTLFPPSERRRTEFAVTVVDNGGLHVRPLDPTAMAHAQKFAELLRERWLREQPDARMAPLRLVKVAESGYCFHVGPATDESDGGADTAPESPLAKQGTEAKQVTEWGSER